MPRSRCVVGLFLLLMTGASCIGGQRTAADAPAEDAKTPRIAARNVVELRRFVGKRIVAHGQIEGTGKSSSGHQFLNFANSELTAFCSRDDIEKFSEGEPAKSYADQRVELEGLLDLHRGKLQIRLRRPDQIRIVDRLPRPPAAGVELKQVGKDTWLSPAGLRYEGRDPDGLTRVAHVARHASDIPNRDGPHGVFDGGESVMFAVIDEAWRLADSRSLRPQLEGNRSSYTVYMNRRIGFLGGRSGVARGNPALNRVFIVFETGTKNIITAFPK